MLVRGTIAGFRWLRGVSIGSIFQEKLTTNTGSQESNVQCFCSFDCRHKFNIIGSSVVCLVLYHMEQLKWSRLFILIVYLMISELVPIISNNVHLSASFNDTCIMHTDIHCVL